MYIHFQSIFFYTVVSSIFVCNSCSGLSIQKVKDTQYYTGYVNSLTMDFFIEVSIRWTFYFVARLNNKIHMKFSFQRQLHTCMSLDSKQTFNMPRLAVHTSQSEKKSCTLIQSNSYAYTYILIFKPFKRNAYLASVPLANIFPSQEFLIRSAYLCRAERIKNP